jgi:quercetin dioxygenase-like cupin family protein
MPELYTGPTTIPVPGGKLIEEHVGRASTGDEAVSVARMHAPAGWDEPAQTPAFDEFTIVLSGRLRVEHDGGSIDVLAGQTVVARAGERIRYLAVEPCDYVAVCVPAFSEAGARRDPA